MTTLPPPVCKELKLEWAAVVAQLVGMLLPIPEVSGLSPISVQHFYANVNL